MGLLSFIFQTLQDIIGMMGLAGIALLMALESMIAPVPSEGVMPFAGFLIATGKFSLVPVLLASSLGSMLGSWISYALGFYGGRRLVLHVRKYFLLSERHLNWTEKFFERYGAKTIFIARFIPVIRHLISIPAGMGKMNLLRFSLYTLVGATIWNGFLVYCGMKLKENWEVIHHASQYLDYVVVAVAIIGCVYLVKARLFQKQ